MENKIEIIQLEYKEKQITLIPTAHVSKESVELTKETIDAIKPDSICIELDKDRYNSLIDPIRYRNTDISKIIKEKKVFMMLVNVILANFQKKIAEKLGSKSGQEMLVGIEKAKELNANLVLADRNVTTTFKRIWANLSFKDKLKLISLLMSSVIEEGEITEEDLKSLQQKDMLTAALNEVSKEFPNIAEVLVDERDKYLAYKIKNAPGTNIVAILGAAHTINIPKYINMEYEIDQYDVIPEKKKSSKLLGWIIPIIIIALILTSFRLDTSIGLQQIKSWILINGSLSALGVLICRGNILSMLTAFIAAPITSLNPLLAAGWFAGLVEAKILKPTVADFDSLSNDLNTFKSFVTNKVTRILLVVTLANLGSTIGTFVSGLNIVKAIFNLI
ncbi:MAG: TraB/GumN family protein [Erysipelotrichia bacterium]|nr:TraB/GumN family protein [Erysipelotrichia bacterium]